MSYVEYSLLAERLRDKGFKEATHDNVICRWFAGDIILDVMPTEEKVFGFGNPWYKPAADNAQKFVLPISGNVIQQIANCS